MTPTPEQAAIIEAAVTTSDSLLISALAGAAKTTTLELIARALPSTPILSIAFNKRIADELSKRLPSNVKAMTMNSVGHRAWAEQTHRRLIVDTRKSYNLLKQAIEDRKRRGTDRFVETLEAVRVAKLRGYIPEGTLTNVPRLISVDDFLAELEDDPDLDLLNTVITASIKEAFAGKIDFDDQIYMPTVFGGVWPRFPLVMVDEAQDLSNINHLMLSKLVTKRLIAVGDPYQSIYAFRGADSDSMARLRRTWNMRELGLSVSFRCPRLVVERARKRAPHMQWAANAAEGSIHAPHTWTLADIPDGAAIICRNNAPLFRMALRLLSAGRGCKLVGSDLGPGLIRTLTKLGPEHLNRAEVERAIDAWMTARLAKKRSEATIRDKADCLRVFASFGATLGAAIAYAKHLFEASGPIQLLSGHKSKGLEWDVVFHLDPWRIPSKFALTHEDKEQERNIQYVIETRAKRELWLVNTNDLDRVEEEVA